MTGRFVHLIPMGDRGDELVEFMPVSEHQQLLDAARAVVEQFGADLTDRGFEWPVMDALAAAVSDRDTPDEARAAKRPAMALRRHQDGTMDDVVVKDVEMFRAEQLDKGVLWLCCYLPNGERVTFNVQAKRSTIIYDVGEMPDDWTDIDDKARR